MNILVVSDNFSMGGLETQIKTYYSNLPQNYKMIFCFGNYKEDVDLKNAQIYTDFSFSYADTIEKFCNDVEMLVKIINENKIDVIQVHPYYCFFASLFASQLTGVKLLYTYHGQGSFNFLKTMISGPIFYHAFEKNCVAKLLTVTQNGKNCFERIGYKNIELIPNPIDEKKFPKATVVNNHKWALISRISDDKIEEIKKMILNIEKFGIDSVDIYGDGNKVEELKNFISEEELNSKINYIGYSNNLYQTVNNKYNGIIGIGRVVLESLMMGYPTILIGYGKITGYINKKIYLETKDYNFINNHTNAYNEKIPSTYDRNFLTNNVKKNYSINSIMKKYIMCLNNCDSIKSQNLVDMYHEIEKFNKNDDLKDCYFYKERLIYNLVKEYIYKNSISPEINNIIVNTDTTYDLYDVIINKLSKMEEK